MSALNSLSTILMLIVPQVPLLAVWLAGMIIAIMRWRQQRPVAQITLIALAVFFVQALLGAVLNGLVPLLVSENGWSAVQVGRLFALVGALQSLVAAVMWGFVLWAIFGWRSAALPSMEQR